MTNNITSKGGARSNLTVHHCCEGWAGSLSRAPPGVQEVNCCSSLATVLIRTIHAAFSSPPARTLFHLREITAWRSGSDSTAGKITSANRFSISATSTGDICPSLTHFLLCRDSGLFSVLWIFNKSYSFNQTFPYLPSRCS